MVVRLRLARHGTRNNPFYHIVAIRNQAARDARPIEKLGEYDPIPRSRSEHLAGSATASSSSSPSSTRPHVIGPVLTSGLEKVQESTQKEKRIEWNVERIHYWLDVGAQPSKPVARLLDRAGLIPEGKFYKGMYRPEGAVDLAQHRAVKQKQGTAPASVILTAAGVPKARQREEKGNASAAMPVQEGETANSTKRTDPKAEASKGGKGEGTVDQMA